MAVMTTAFHPVSPNRRRRVRHRIQTPAYATFTAQSQATMLDLHEIVDISEEGAAIQCHAPLEVDQQVNLCLDLADCEHIYTSGQVVWANTSGRAGLHFSQLSPESVSRLREWLFVNVMAGVANGEAEVAPFVAPFIGSRADVAPPPNYTDTLEAVTAIQRQVEALGPDLAAALQLIADRAQTLVRASGAAIALAGADPDFMICRASSGPDAPPVGAPLQVGSGFSGECVKTGLVLRCDDTEFDLRVDRDNCRALGLRSILAVPVRVREKSIGLVEVFSAQSYAFSDDDSGVLQRLADTVLAAVNRAARAEDLPPLGAPSAVTRFAPMPGSVLFASAPEEEKKTESADEKTSGGIRLPGSPLIILGIALAMTFLALGYNLAPWIQAKLEHRAPSPIQTVLASSHPPKPEVTSSPAVETASFDQLRQMAENNDPAAENALGLRYYQGDEKNLIVKNEVEASRWFLRAADHGSLPAQAKLGALYWGGRGVPKNVNEAYFWTVLARARGDKDSKDLAHILANEMTHSQTTEIEQKANLWLQQHIANWKPAAGH
jgi:hypothetical protein